MKKILIADDFYSDFVLYKTNYPEELISTVKKLLNGENAEIDEKKHKEIGSSNGKKLLSTETAIQKADEIIFTSDLYDE